MNPWDSDYRTRNHDFDDHRSERCTSAPPPETSFLFGRNEGLVAPAVRSQRKMTLCKLSQANSCFLVSLAISRHRILVVEDLI